MTVFTDDGWRAADRDEFLRAGHDDARGSRRCARRSVPAAASPRATRPASPTARRRASSPPRRRPPSSACPPGCGSSAFAFAGVEPELMGLGPVPATRRVLEQAGLTLDDIGLFELNEPFAVQVLTWCDELGVDPDDPRLNPYGGAIACGHPLAATGVRLMAQLAYGFRERPAARYGLTALCIGMGMGAAVALGEHRRCAERDEVQAAARRDGAGPVALVTIDNGEDYTQAERRSAAPRSSRWPRRSTSSSGGDWAALLLTGKPFVFCAGADIDEFPGATAELAREGEPRRSRAVRPAARAAVPDARRDQRRVRSAAAWSSRSTATTARSRLGRPPLRLPGGLPRASPGWGGTQLIPRLVGAEAAVTLRSSRTRCARTACSTAARRSSSASPTRCSSRSSSSTSRSSSLVERMPTGRDEPAARPDRSDEVERLVARRARARRRRSTARRRAPYRALDLIEGAATWSARGGYRRRGGRARRPPPRRRRRRPRSTPSTSSSAARSGAGHAGRRAAADRAASASSAPG